MQIMGDFLIGKKVPNGYLTQTQYRAHVFNIIDFVTRPQTLDYLLDFDSEAFFQTIAKLFNGKPWDFFNLEMDDYVFEFTKQDTVQAETVKSHAIKNRNAKQRHTLAKGRLQVD